MHIDDRYSDPVLIGSGGMAEVYRAHDRRLDRDVAIKIIRQETSDKPQFRQRFKREIRMLTSLQHPNIIPVYDCSAEESSTYYVMALLEGKTLAEYVPGGHISGLFYKTVMEGMLAALSCAHGKGVIHRDIKPENIFISTNGDPVLMDFGIAGAVDEEATCLTQAGSFIGTCLYASPEQLNGERLTPATDIYSLGLVLQAMLCGGLPYSGTMSQIIQQKTMQPTPEPPSTHPVYEMLPALKSVLPRMLAREPEQRYGSCEEILRDLRRATSSVSSGSAAESQPGVKPRVREEASGGPVTKRITSGFKWVAVATVVAAILILGLKGKSRIAITEFDASESISGVVVDGVSYSFHSGNLFDDNPATSWQPKDIVGGWFTVRLPGKNSYEIRIINGFASRQGLYDWYYRNNRVRSVDVISSEGVKAITLQDGNQEYQSLGTYETDFFQIRITGIYPGQKWNDTAISDAIVFRR
ncbi:MAG TPA: serine/threonine-protein kinase [Spirochaetota bacterium]|nr:serine/threonine-protein kinase [Spirochaetota bacterium]HPH02819.1 serine/threonine-protein kinase [Spirochaetota bacterium]